MNEPAQNFHVASTTKERINRRLELCNISREQNQLIQWHVFLTTIYMEGQSFFKKSDEEQMTVLKKEEEKAFFQYQEYLTNYEAESPKRRGEFKPPRDLYDKLWLLESKLRVILSPLIASKLEDDNLIPTE